MEAAGKAMSELTDEERQQLIAKMDEDLDAFIQSMVDKSQKRKMEAGPVPEKSVDEVIEELQRHPAFMKEIDWSKPLSPEMEGLMALKYETENPTARAESYKDEGNYCFKKKDYRTAIENYTEAIRSRCPSKEVNAILYTNRAAAQFHLQNYRSALIDSVFARKFKTDHMKAIIRGAMCCIEIKKFADAIKWCDSGLLVEPKNEKLLSLRVSAVNKKKAKERDERKQAALERKEEEEEKKLLEEIQSRGIKVASLVKLGSAVSNPLMLSSLEGQSEAKGRIHLDDQGALVWPVFFFYPEYGQTDFVEAFNENDTMYAHIEHMFGPQNDSPGWDEENKYHPDKIVVYFEDKKDMKLYPVDVNWTLLQTLKHKKYVVHAGTASFLLMVEGSEFQRDFVNKYET